MNRILSLILLSVLSLSALALTPAQQATLKTYIANDLALNAQPNNNTGNGKIANALNAEA